MLIALDELLKRQARRKDIALKMAQVRPPLASSPEAVAEVSRKMKKYGKEYTEECSLVDYDIDTLRLALEEVYPDEADLKLAIGGAAERVPMDDATRAIIERMEKEAADELERQRKQEEWERERAEKAAERARKEIEEEAAARGEVVGQMKIDELGENDAAIEGSDEGTEQAEDDSDRNPGERENVHSPERGTKSRSRRKNTRS